MSMVPETFKKYKEVYIKELKEVFGYKSVMQVPRLQKIVINMGVGEGAREFKALEKAMEELAMIAGQRPALRRAKKSISNFKIRQGMPIGCSVTLRGKRMYEFLERLVHIVLPRVRDFRGLPKNSFDGTGNYSFGLTEQVIFPEVNIDKVDRVQGMNITFVTSAKTDEEAFELLRRLGLPFRR